MLMEVWWDCPKVKFLAFWGPILVFEFFLFKLLFYEGSRFILDDFLDGWWSGSAMTTLTYDDPTEVILLILSKSILNLGGELCLSSTAIVFS